MEDKPRTKQLPDPILEWLVASRIRLLNDLKEGRPVKHFAAHLPILATWQDEVSYPVNMTVKGIGLIPKNELLDKFSKLFADVFAESQGSAWEKTLVDRIEALLSLYRDIEHFDPALLGGLEIFEGKTLRNLRNNPRASLLYTGTTDTSGRFQYISFQVNGAVELLSKEDRYYRFLLAARKLFEYDQFHLPQPDYPWGYIIRVEEVIDKSPRIKEP